MKYAKFQRTHLQSVCIFHGAHISILVDEFFIRNFASGGNVNNISFLQDPLEFYVIKRSYQKNWNSAPPPRSCALRGANWHKTRRLQTVLNAPLYVVKAFQTKNAHFLE